MEYLGIHNVALLLKKRENFHAFPKYSMNLQVVLLCGGKSSRMWPLSDKILFEYLGKTVLEHQVEMLLQNKEVELVHIVANPDNLSSLQNIIKLRFPEKKSLFRFFVQKTFQGGMRDGVLAISKQIDVSLPLLVMSSNDFVESSLLKKLLKQAEKSRSQVFLCGKKVKKYFSGGYLVLNSHGFVKKIVEKPGEGKEPSDFVNLVFHLFKRPEDLFMSLKKVAGKQDGYEQSLQMLLQKEKQVEVVSYVGFWQSLKYPWDHLLLMKFFLDSLKKSKIHSSVKISKHAILSGNLFIEKGVKIFDYAVVNGPAFIGENCVLGNHCLLRESHLGNNCVVGHSTEIARSYFLQKVQTHQNYIGDSVIDENVSFGAGVRTGNFRLDEKEIEIKIKNEKIKTNMKKIGVFCGKNVRIGINSSLMPGVKIGEKSFINSGSVLFKDVKKQQFIKTHNIILKRKNSFMKE